MLVTENGEWHIDTLKNLKSERQHSALGRGRSRPRPNDSGVRLPGSGF